jgi:hypothetical protein
LMRDPLHAPRAPRGTRDGTVVIDAAAPGSKTVATHGAASGTERSPILVDLRRGAGGSRVLAPPRLQGHNRRAGFGLEKLVEAMGIEATVIDDRAHGEW